MPVVHATAYHPARGLRSAPLVTNTLVLGREATPPLDGVLELGPATVLPSLGAASLVVRGFAEPVFGVSFFRWCVGRKPDSDDLLACVELDHLPMTAIALADHAGSIVKSVEETHNAYVTALACSGIVRVLAAVWLRVIPC